MIGESFDGAINAMTVAIDFNQNSSLQTLHLIAEDTYIRLPSSAVPSARGIRDGGTAAFPARETLL
jgi:hypothetical protein